MIKEKKSGQVIVISSPSGGGKGSIIKGLLKNDNQTRWLSISTTTRKKRKSDIEGVTYNFTTKEDFENKIKQNYFLEYATYADNYYGTPKNSIKEKIDKGIDVILEIEIEGAKNIKKIIPEAIFIFIMPPSLEVLLKRLKNRNTETKETIIKRFNAAYKEINEVSKYNYVVVNDKLDITIDKVESIIKAEKCRVDRIEEVYLDNKEEYIHELLIDKQFDNSEILK